MSRLTIRNQARTQTIGRKTLQIGDLYLPNCSKGTRCVWPYRMQPIRTDRKSTRLNSSHQIISYAVFCLKKKKNTIDKKIALEMMQRMKVDKDLHVVV